jgi:hypothetical protein
LEAAKRVRLDKVPVIVLDLKPQDAQAYRILDNKIGEEAVWKETELLNEIQALLSTDYDLSVLGFSNKELDELIAKINEATSEVLTDNSETENSAPTESIVKPGDVWRIGNSYLVCGDSLKSETHRVITTLAGPIRLCITDPPFDLPWKDQQVAVESCGATSLVLFGGGKQIFEFLKYSDWDYHQDLVLLRPSCTQPSAAKHILLFVHQNILVLTRNGAKTDFSPYRFRAASGQLTSVFEYPQVKKGRHHYAKPLWLIKGFVNAFSDNSVYDPFLGAGTTLFACEEEGKQCFGIEIEPSYCDLVIETAKQKSLSTKKLGIITDFLD